MSAEQIIALDADSRSLERLARAVQGGDVDAGSLTDEDVLLMTGTGADPEPHYDAPRLSLLPDEQRALALATALRVLQARQLAEPAPGGGVRLAGLPGLVGDVRETAELVLRVRVEARDGTLRRAVVYRAREDLFLTERVSPQGLHACTFRARDAQARWLATAVAPNLRNGRTEPPRSFAAPEDLELGSEELAAASDVAALVTSTCTDDTPVRSFHAFSDATGVQVLQGRQPGGAAITLQRLSAQALVAFCAAFLAGDAA